MIYLFYRHYANFRVKPVTNMFSPYLLRGTICLISLVVTHWQGVTGIIDGNLRFRTVCYPNDHQPNCDTEFTDVYTNLSWSTYGRTRADTWFWLFTRENPDTPELLHKCGERLPPNSNFNSENDLYVIIAPFMGGICDVAVYREWVIQMLERGDYNILVVDWSWGSKTFYNTAVNNSKIMAKQTVIVLENIQEDTGIPKDQITLVGHSLGAHAAAFIGQDFPVAKIIGLDPAGPNFDKSLPLDERLDNSDADYVEVWHTNAGDCVPYFGVNYDAGHVDFWINDGSDQTSNCFGQIPSALLRGDILFGIGSLLPTACSHLQCAQFYKLSINPGSCQYVGVKCDNYKDFRRRLKCRRCGKKGENCLIMGFDTYKYAMNNPEAYGRYYVKTSNRCPYCKNSHLRFQGFRKTYQSSLQSSKNDTTY